MNKFLFICDNNGFEDEFSIIETNCPLEKLYDCERTLQLTRFSSTRDVEMLKALISCGYEAIMIKNSHNRIPYINMESIYIYRGHSGNY